MLDRLRNSTYIHFMNYLPIEKKIQIINLLIESKSIRATSSLADVSINTVTKLFVDVGQACQLFHDETVRNVVAKRVQCDKIWSFVYTREKDKPQNVEDAGGAWTFVGIDSDSKLVISWLLGNRDTETATFFMKDVAERISGPVQITADGLKANVNAEDDAFPTDHEIDFAQQIKLDGTEYGTSYNERKYCLGEYTGNKKQVIYEKPDERFISINHREHQNLTTRMHASRFTKHTNSFSKKIENCSYAIALHFVYYNFVKQHKTLGTTPAMAAGLTKHFMSIQDLVKLVPEPKANKKSSDKKKGKIE